jgi:hypothetical protein
MFCEHAKPRGGIATESSDGKARVVITYATANARAEREIPGDDYL